MTLTNRDLKTDAPDAPVAVGARRRLDHGVGGKAGQLTRERAPASARLSRACVQKAQLRLHRSPSI
jgi:hypothetical protein